MRKFSKMEQDDILNQIEKCNEQIRRYKEKIQIDGYITEAEYCDMLELERLVKYLRRM